MIGRRPGDNNPPSDTRTGDLFGTPPHMLVRRNDPDTSHEAATKVDSSRLEQMVYQAIVDYGRRGCISDEVRARFPDLPYSSVTARYSALLRKKLIVDTGRRRKGDSGKPQRILIAACWAGNEETVRQ